MSNKIDKRILAILFAVSPLIADASHYVGSNACRACHAEIFAAYSQTAMGRSMVHGDDPGLRGRLPVPFTLFDRDSGEYFEVSQKSGDYYQSQYAVDRDGKEVFRQNWKLSYVVGSGENGYGFLLERGGYLFEAPLSYYTKTKAWSFSPGYERRNLAFTRPVIPACIACHAGRPQPVYAKPGLYRDPPFAELAVGCENCHGPGEQHVAKSDLSIVNPARLSGWLSDNICMACHQGGDARVEMPDRHVDDFRPGTPLNQVLAIFVAPLKRDAQPRSVLLDHYYSMTLSKCYRASAGKLSCISCHDPHRPAAAAQKCLACHQPANCRASIEDRSKTNPPDACATCHMSKRTVTTIVHAALTDHRIAGRPDEPYPEDAFRPGVSVLTSTPGHSGDQIPDITLFQAYTSLRMEERAGEVVNRIAQASPKDPRVLSALARRSPSTPEAIHYLQQVVQAGSPTQQDLLLLTALESRVGNDNDAIPLLQVGIRQYPYSRGFPEMLAALYVRRGEYRAALNTIRAALELFPDDFDLRALQEKVQAAMIP